MRAASRTLAVAAAVAFGLGLSACTAAGAHSAAAPSQTAWSVQPTAAAPSSGTPSAAKGTAAQNKQAFDATIERVLAKNSTATGANVAAALESAGFPKSTLQYSASKTSANLVAGSVQLSAQFGSSCLIGQWGSAVGGYHSAIAPALGSGGCLVGGGGTGTTPPTTGAQLGD